MLQNSVGKGGFAVVDMSDNAEVSYFVLWKVQISHLFLNLKLIHYNYIIHKKITQQKFTHLPPKTCH